MPQRCSIELRAAIYSSRWLEYNSPPSAIYSVKGKEKNEVGNGRFTECGEEYAV
jgi:hypothetical protein